MFGQLVFARLRAAEKALKDGRLDEAYRLATAPDLREHRRAAAVLEKLAERFLDRARQHYRADRCAEALRDLDKATTAGVRLEEIQELRRQVLVVWEELKRNERSRYERLDAAAKRAERGSLAAGRRILEQASESDRAAKQLQNNLGQRADEAMNVIDQAEKHIANRQWAAAAERVKRAKALDKHNERVAQVEDRLCDLVLQAARTALVQGRLSRAADELACLGELGEALPARRELVDLLGIAHQASDALVAHNYPEARRHVLALNRLLPEAKWVKASIDRLKRVDDLRTDLCAGPLGERMEPIQAKGRAAGPVPSLDDTVALPGRATGASGLPGRLLLLVDGGGSYLLLRGDRASIGRVVSGDPADVVIFSDLAERHAHVNRAGDDYFLLSEKEAEVGGRRTRRHLLRDGERVVLGRKAKFTFRLPSRKSPTAVLDLSDTTKMPNDVRRVVLFRHHATIGASSGAHITCRHAGPPVVLFERDGMLWVRKRSDGHVDAAAQRLAVGEPVEIGGASLVLEPWRLRNLGSTKI